MKEQRDFQILITRRSTKSKMVDIRADNYHQAVESVMKLARLERIDWGLETAIIEHEIESNHPEQVTG